MHSLPAGRPGCEDVTLSLGSPWEGEPHEPLGSQSCEEGVPVVPAPAPGRPGLFGPWMPPAPELCHQGDGQGGSQGDLGAASGPGPL
ncbi:hypothetical protein MC885_016020 [Smutsia gigantea]|nr:hypothetical protein MC885_016020 [Smutsia gigantea]